jgi:hypothetical protein
MEKRHYRRFLVEGVEGTLMFTTEASILNISVEGVALKAGRRFEIGREYTLKLEYNSKTITLNGIVMWSFLSELVEDPHKEMMPIYSAGMKFKNIITDKMTDLMEFIEKNKIEEDQRLTIRFDVKSPEKTILDGPHSYSVKKISMSGMLIETDMPFQIDDKIPMEIVLSRDKKISFLGRVAFCMGSADELPAHYDIGIEFLEMSEEGKAVFKEYIEAL